MRVIKKKKKSNPFCSGLSPAAWARLPIKSVNRLEAAGGTAALVTLGQPLVTAAALVTAADWEQLPFTSDRRC